jgi:hypothetical protein
MSTEPEAQNESLADDLFSSATYEALPPVERPFLPWHRPRKQFVREGQWVEQINRLYDESDGDRKEFRYLGLPGVDLLDLRFFHSRICQPRALEMSFLGFNSEAADGTRAQIELNISLDEVRKLSDVNSRSIVVRDDFFAVANDTSVAYKRAINGGPYDVINIDLCDGLGGPGSSVPGRSAHEAIARLLSLQFRYKHPWLLLLTTRVGKAHVEKTFLDKLLNRYNENLKDCKDFRDNSEALFTIADLVSLGNAVQTDTGLLPIYLISIFKWLLGMAIKSNPPSELELKSVVGYRVESTAPCEDLCSLAVRFTPCMSVVNDSTGIITPSLYAPDECKMSVAALKRVSKRRDADALLASDRDLRNTLAESMGDLLESARYSRERYVVWVAAEESKCV